MKKQRLKENERLLKQAKSGDQGALAKLCDILRVEIRPIIQYRLRGRLAQSWEDALQDVMETFIKRLPDIGSNPEKYVLQIVRNRVGGVYRANRSAKEIPYDEQLLEMAGDKGDLSHDIEVKDLEENIRNMLGTLGEFCRLVLTALLEGRNLTELWEFFKKREPNLSHKAFYARVERCRQKMNRWRHIFI